MAYDALAVPRILVALAENFSETNGVIDTRRGPRAGRASSVLAELLKTKSINVTQMLGKMEVRGLVRLDPHLGVRVPRRTDVIALTSAGRDLAERIRRHEITLADLLDSERREWARGVLKKARLVDELRHATYPPEEINIDSLLGESAEPVTLVGEVDSVEPDPDFVEEVVEDPSSAEEVAVSAGRPSALIGREKELAPKIITRLKKDFGGIMVGANGIEPKLAKLFPDSSLEVILSTLRHMAADGIIERRAFEMTVFGICLPDRRDQMNDQLDGMRLQAPKAARQAARRFRQAHKIPSFTKAQTNEEIEGDAGDPSDDGEPIEGEVGEEGLEAA